MSWQAIVALLLPFLGDLLERLIGDLLKNAKPDGTPDGLDAQLGMARLFAAARAETWMFQFGKRRLLTVAERVATKRAKEFWHAARTGAPAPVPTAAERFELDEAV
jgi:hypothetical protein